MTHEEIESTQVERTVAAELRAGNPVYISKPCPDCGGPVWLRLAQDGVRFATDEDMPRSHGAAHLAAGLFLGLRAFAVDIASHYADAGTRGAIACKYCGEWLKNDTESLADQHMPDCLVMRARAVIQDN